MYKTWETSIFWGRFAQWGETMNHIQSQFAFFKQTTSSLLMSLTVLTVLSSCTQKSQQQQLPVLLQDSQNIMSTRPQAQTHVMALVKFKTSPLLLKVQKENGINVISAEAFEQIKAEQEAALTEIKKLSSEIQVIYKYKYVVNAVALLAPAHVLEKLSALGSIASVEKVGSFHKPQPFLKLAALNASASAVQGFSLLERNSAIFVGATELNKSGLTGKGLKVGIIDTGIDYTHSMFKGVGTPEAYKAVDPSQPSTGFPNERVVGGVDLVGTHYDSGSPDFMLRVPRPDLNPLDEGGHGTHVAGTVAGIGDGVNSYNGMAPEADLYAIKVFGANGSTSDMVVIAALEYAVDPNGDGSLNDQLDIVNLSLGSSYGNPKLLYAEALKNLTLGGTLAAISAGNSGPEDYIVGAPGTSTEALSVAASIDDTAHNWTTPAVEVLLSSGALVVEGVEAATTAPIAQNPVSGKLVYLGLAATELTEEQKQAVRGNIALIDRGAVAFNDKIKRAYEAGATGVVVANNKEGAPFVMGTTEAFPIPAVMIAVQAGMKAQEELSKGLVVEFKFKSEKKIEKPEVIDTLTDFSSKGPRSIDGFLKPEISAPGSLIISAEMGGGNKAVKMSGTSMAAPHIAGLAALVKQSYKNRQIEMTALELKNVMMGTSKTIGEKETRYPVSRQGAGRVQVVPAAQSLVVVSEPSISFGEINIETKKIMKAVLHIRNLSDDEMSYKVDFEGNEFIRLNNAQTVTLAPQQTLAVSLNFTLDASGMSDQVVREMDGFVFLKANQKEMYRVPVLAIAHKMSAITASELKINAGKNDFAGSLAQLKLTNSSKNQGEVQLFNLVALDQRKPLATDAMNADCDLQAVGYRIVQKTNDAGVTQKYVQFGLKTYKPMTTWHPCDVSIMIDQNGDGLAEQELLGATMSSIPGVEDSEFASTLLNATKAREIRKAFEALLEKYKNNPEELKKLKGTEDYSSTIVQVSDFTKYNNSTVLVVEAPVKNLAVNSQNELTFQVIMTHNEQNSQESDDYLVDEKKAFKISLNENDQAFTDLSSQAITVNSLAEVQVELIKGEGDGSLLLLMPQNKMSFSDSLTDMQSQVTTGVFAE